MREARPRSGRSSGTTVAVAAVLLATSLLGTRLALGSGPSCPPVDRCPTLAELRNGSPLSEAMHVYDAGGRSYADVGGPLRRALPLDSFPDILIEGFPAVEDRRFREHGGVDLQAILRAVARNVSEAGIAEGASTIPMQLTRTLWGQALRDTGPWERKLLEARTALTLVHSLGRDRVLELYLNGVYMDDGIYGVGAASLHYFGVPPKDLDLASAATLIGLVKTPGRLNPREHPEEARARRNVVLSVLAREGVITREQADAARARPVTTVPEPPINARRDYVTAAVRRELGRVAPELVGQNGLRIHTTIDPRIQRAGEQALEAHLGSVERGALGRFQGVPLAEAEDPASVLQGAAIAMDPASGAIRALIGGRSFEQSEMDRALQSRRQIGSLVKPFIVAGALAQGRSLADPISTAPLTIRTATGLWTPRDHIDEDTLALRELITRSSNRAAVRVGQEIGLSGLDRVARALGLEEPVPAYPSSFLGSFEASLARLTAMYAAFGNGGWRIEPHLIRRVDGPDGQVLWEREEPISGTRALDPATAFLVLDALQGVVDEGTAWRVRRSYHGPAAGKTGTTDEGRDAWFIGLTPGLAAGVWVGFDLPREIVPGADGARLAVPVWAEWLGQVSGDEDLYPWQPPIGVQRAMVDGRSGAVLPAGCRATGPLTRNVYVRTSMRPAPRHDTCPLAPPDPSLLDRRRADRMRSMFRIPRVAPDDTLRRR